MGVSVAISGETDAYSQLLKNKSSDEALKTYDLMMNALIKKWQSNSEFLFDFAGAEFERLEAAYDAQVSSEMN